MSSQLPNSQIPKKYMTSMGPLLAFASSLPYLRTCFLHTMQAVKPYFPISPSTDWSKQSHTIVLVSDAFNSIFVIRREDDNMLMNFIVEPITHPVRQQLKKRFIQEVRKGQLQAYHWQCFESVGCFSPFFAGLFFEVKAQLRLRGEIVLSLVPMVKQQRTRRRKTALWVSRSGKRLAPSMIPITLKPTTTVEYEWSTLSEIYSGIFYVPKPSDQVISDSFI